MHFKTASLTLKIPIVYNSKIITIMRTTKNSLNTREVFDDYLRSHHKRRTRERSAILERIIRTSGHFSAEDMCSWLMSDGFPVSTSTVYATLDILIDAGILFRHRFSDRGCLYERRSMSSTVHHHLICTSCNKIKEVRDSVLTELIDNRRYTGFTPTHYTLTIYGICGACIRKSRRISKTK